MTSNSKSNDIGAKDVEVRVWTDSPLASVSTSVSTSASVKASAKEERR
jgi:hypothetical protein